MRVCDVNAMAAALAAILLGPVQAQDAAVLENVQISGVRDPDAFDVAKGLALQQAFNAISEPERDKVRLGFFVEARDESVIPAGMTLALYTADGDRPLKLLPSGELVLPAMSDAGAVGAELVAPVKRGTVKIVYYIDVRQTSSPMSVGYLRAALVQARGAWRKLYGPLLGWSVPAFTCAKAIFAQPSVVTVRAGPGDAAVAWHSEAAAEIHVPLRPSELHDEFIVDWGPSMPWRIGGCVEEARAEYR